MWLFVCIFCVVFVILAVHLVWRQMRRTFCLKSLPKVPFKVLVPFLRPNKTTTELFQMTEKMTNYYDSLAAFWSGLDLTVICDDPVNLKTILTSKDCLDKPYLYRLVPETAEGIVFSEGNPNHDECYRFRKMIFPPFF